MTDCFWITKTIMRILRTYLGVMLNWLRKTEAEVPNLSFLTVDMHSHLIPGIDDGVQSEQEAVERRRKMESYESHHLNTTLCPIRASYRIRADIAAAQPGGS